MNLLFTLCARAGSKGIKGKNAGDLAGLPLAYYTLAVIDLYKEAHPDDDIDVVLSTDSDELMELVEASGIDHLNVGRPEELAGDKVAKIDAIRYAFQEAESRTGKHYDAVIDLDNTSPLRTLDDLERVVEKRCSSMVPVIFTVVPARRNPWFNMVIEQDGVCKKVLESDFIARQQAPEVFDMNASIYAYSREFMQSDTPLSIEGCEYVIMTDTGVLDLDRPDDLKLMEVIAAYLFDNDQGMHAVRVRAEELTQKNEVQSKSLPKKNQIEDYLTNQLAFFGGADISDYLEAAYKRALYCFSRNTNKYFKKGTIDVHHTGQYAILLCYLARVAFEAGDRETADRVYALNKALHGFDIFYEVELPNVFFMEHSVGTVLGRAKYSDRLFLGQNVTVGGNKGCYPTIGENVCLHAGCMVVGDSHLGNNIEVSAQAFIRDEVIPDNCLVFGKSPNLVIKQRSYEEMKSRLYFFEYDD